MRFVPEKGENGELNCFKIFLQAFGVEAMLAGILVSLGSAALFSGTTVQVSGEALNQHIPGKSDFLIKVVVAIVHTFYL